MGGIESHPIFLENPALADNHLDKQDAIQPHGPCAAETGKPKPGTLWIINPGTGGS